VKAELDRINVEKQLRAIAKSGGGKNDEEEGKSSKVQKVTTRLISDVVQAVRSMVKLPGHVDQQTWLDGTQRPNCVILENCILDIDAFLEQRDDWNLPHSPNWFSGIHLPYSIDLTCKNCQSPKWDAFLARVLPDDPDAIRTLQEWMGYCLTHDATFQKFLFLEGEGSNGKSVFCAALTALLGRQNVSNVPLERFGDRFSLSTTLGKLANIATECSEMDNAAEGILKAFTSGDPMQFEVKHKQPFSAIPTARFMMSANNRPRFKDGSSALWRRMMIVKFDQTISQEERVYGMDNPRWWEQSGELPGIFWWAVLGLHRLRSQWAFTESTKSKEAIQEYREETNPARSFLFECCEAADPSAVVFSKELYEGYCKWCRANGYHPFGEMRFGKEVKRTFPGTDRKRVSTRGERPWYYTGLTYTSSSEF
jgi:P4 family phage/plasmid primase-like protien